MAIESHSSFLRYNLVLIIAMAGGAGAMRHVFKAKRLGWGNDKTEGVWFDADDYTKEKRRKRSLNPIRGHPEGL